MAGEARKRAPRRTMSSSLQSSKARRVSLISQQPSPLFAPHGLRMATGSHLQHPPRASIKGLRPESLAKQRAGHPPIAEVRRWSSGRSFPLAGAGGICEAPRPAASPPPGHGDDGTRDHEVLIHLHCRLSVARMTNESGECTVINAWLEVRYDSEYCGTGPSSKHGWRDGLRIGRRTTRRTHCSPWPKIALVRPETTGFSSV